VHDTLEQAGWAVEIADAQKETRSGSDFPEPGGLPGASDLVLGRVPAAPHSSGRPG
jgi:hypothetical protein